ncbi:MAG: alkaline phosphatase [Bacillota bacterium]
MKKAISVLLALVLMLAYANAFAGEAAAVPKYVFMFIGDGMGSPQVTATQYYLGAVENPDSSVPTPAQLSFTEWKNVGLITTYDATSFNPDSASTASAMASGIKTLSGVVNYNFATAADGSLQLTDPSKLITEYVKEAGKKVGVISSVSLNHATPAAYYAKQQSRNDYYEIGVQALTGTTLDFLGGGNLHKMTAEGKHDTAALAAENGWTIVNTLEGFAAISADQAPVLANNPDIADSNAIAYEIDRVRREGEGEDILSLADIVKAGITVLDSEDGFFLMVEGGKIDWSCHANDAATSIWDTIALDDAVQVAIDFAAEHADETLIIVTGDHETGGMTIGFATTAYDTHFDYLQNQTISFQDFTAIAGELRDSGATFEDALAQIEAYYGLTATPDTNLSLTEAELAALQAAYTLSMTPAADRVLGDQEALLYGGYEPLSMAVSHIINNKAGLSYTSYAHTGLQIPVYAFGVNADLFNGMYDNTDLFVKTREAMGLTVTE